MFNVFLISVSSILSGCFVIYGPLETCRKCQELPKNLNRTARYLNIVMCPLGGLTMFMTMMGAHARLASAPPSLIVHVCLHACLLIWYSCVASYYLVFLRTSPRSFMMLFALIHFQGWSLSVRVVHNSILIYTPDLW